ncbi:WD repeat-containing protein 41-like [Arapaima gigas]
MCLFPDSSTDLQMIVFISSRVEVSRSRTDMLRWIFGGREAPGIVEKSPVLVIGEEQPKNVYTELQVLKGHYDIVRFLAQIDDLRFASGGDDGLVLVWNMQTGECLQELRGHSQQITALAAYSGPSGGRTRVHLLTASSDRTLSMWDPDTGNRVKMVSDLLSSAKRLYEAVQQ